MKTKQSKLKLYMYKTPDGFYLAEMEPMSPDEVPVYGAIDPVTCANYYKQLEVSPILKSDKFTMGMDGWLEWFINHALPNGWAKISDDFPFNPKKLKTVELVEK